MSTFYKVQTGFQIVDSNGVPGTPVDGVSTELTDSISKIPTDKAVHDAIEEATTHLASSEEVSVTGTGTETSPYSLDLTGKMYSNTGIDIKSEQGSDVTLFSSMDIGATASRSISMESGYNINMKAPNMLTEEALFEILTIAPYEYNYVSNKWAVAVSRDADARNIQFDGSLGEYLYRKTVTVTGPITETATGQLSLVSSGATAEFKGAGPTTVESTGGAPVTVQSTGNSSNYSSLVVTPNSGTLSVNASTANHTLSMFSKSVVNNNTSYAQIDLNDSSGVNIHTNASTINVESEGGAPITTKVTGDTTHYSTIESQVTQVRITAAGSTSPTNFTVSGNGSSSSITGYAKNITMLGSAVQGDGTPSFRAGTVNGTTSISGDSIDLIGVSSVRMGPSGSSPISLVMEGDSSSGVSSATLNAKNITLTAYQVPSDTTGTSSISISNPPYGAISMSPTGLSFIYPTLPIFVNTNDLRLPAYAKAYDTTDTHKLMTRADTTGSVELATFSELTNEQFGLDENTSAGTIFYVDQVADTVEPGDPQTYHPEVEKLSPGTTGQVLSVGSSGLEWTTPSTGTNWYLGAFTTAQRPASPTEGQYGYDTTIDCVIWYIGGYWKNSAGAIV